MSKRATIKAVAAQAGVSYQTVSRVINDNDGVSPETRHRVLAAVKALNYQPSVAARALVQQRTSIIGAIFPYTPGFMFSDYHHMQILGGVEYGVSSRGRSLLLSMPRVAGTDRLAWQRFLKQRIADGIIVEGGTREDGIELLMNAGYPLVVVGYTTLPVPSVHPDDEGGAYSAVQHLLALGHRRIGIISGPAEGSLAIQARWAGCERAFRDAGLVADRRLLIHGDYTHRGGYRAARELLQAHRADPPTAVFALNDSMAIGAIHRLREEGYSVPGDVSVVGFDDIANAEMFDPPLTTVRIFGYDLGCRAAETLFEIVSGNVPSTQEIVLPSSLIVRRSTVPLR